VSLTRTCFSKRLRCLRKLTGKSQQQLFKETGIPQTTISCWENAIGEPSVSDLPKLAAALGVSVAELLNDKPPAKAVTKSNKEVAS